MFTLRDKKLAKESAWLSGIVSFLIAFAVFAFININIDPNARFVHDFSSVYAARSLLGIETGLLSNDYYYGGCTLISFFVLKLFETKGPVFLWKACLGVMALLRAVSAFCATYISQRYFRLNSKLSVFIGLIATFLSPINGMYFNNDTILDCVFWLLLLVMVEYEMGKSISSKTIFSLLMVFLLILLPIIDIQTIVIVLAFFVAKILNDIKTKNAKGIINNVLLLVLCVLGIVVIHKLSFAALFDNSIRYSRIIHSPNRFFKTIRRESFLFVKNIADIKTWISLSDVFFGNVWELILFSFGFFPVLVFSCFTKDRRKYYQRFSCFFIILSVLFSVILTQILNFNAMFNFHADYESLVPSCFKIEDYSFLVGPVIVFAYGIFTKFRTPHEKNSILIRSFVIQAIVLLEILISFLGRYILQGRDITKLFGLITRFYCKFMSFNNRYMTLGLIVIISFSVLAIPLLFCSAKNYKGLLAVLTILSMSFYFDYVYRLDYFVSEPVSYSMISSVDSICDLLDSSDVPVIYSYGTWEKASIIQIQSRDTTVINQLPEFDKLDSFVLHTNTPNEMKVDVELFKDCYVAKLDDDEYVVFKGDDNYAYFDSLGYTIEDQYKSVQVNNFINEAYWAMLNRSVDHDGFVNTRDALYYGNRSAFDFLSSFVYCEEYQYSGLSYKRIVNRLFDLCMTEEPTIEERRMWGYYVDSDESLVAFIEYLAVQPRFTETCEIIGLVPLYEDVDYEEFFEADYNALYTNYRLDSVISGSYSVFLNREADDIGREMYTNSLLDNDISVRDLFSIFMYSDEFRSKPHENLTMIIGLYRVCAGKEPDKLQIDRWYSRIHNSEGLNEFIDYVLEFNYIEEYCEDLNIESV